ncbi:MAG: hypothetical protein FJ278_13975 [Planctomycetes bacterium]|nr:hypothetical protein [Planctomycetota bacterium]
MRSLASGILALALIALLGCSSVAPTGYLTDYTAMKPVKGINLDLIKAIDGAPLDAYPVVVINDVTIPDKITEAFERAEKYGPYLQRRVEKELVALRKFKIVTVDKRFLDFGKYDLRPARLDLAITDMAYGSGLLRYLIGWDSLGATIVQVEGKLVDPQTGQTLLEFADRRRNSGEPGLGFNFRGVKRVFKPSYLVSASLHFMSADIAKLMASLKTPAPVAEKREG